MDSTWDFFLNCSLELHRSATLRQKAKINCAGPDCRVIPSGKF